MDKDKESLETVALTEAIRAKNTQIEDLQRYLGKKEAELQKLVETNLEKDKQIDSYQQEIEKLQKNLEAQKDSFKRMREDCISVNHDLIGEKTEILKQLEEKRCLVFQNQKKHEQIVKQLTTERDYYKNKLKTSDLKVAKLSYDLAKCQKVNQSLNELIGKNDQLKIQVKFLKEKLGKVEKGIDGLKKKSHDEIGALQTLLQENNYVTLDNEEGGGEEMITGDNDADSEADMD